MYYDQITFSQDIANKNNRVKKKKILFIYFWFCPSVTKICGVTKK